MATVCRTIVFLAGILIVGTGQIWASEDMAEMNERLTQVESHQSEMRNLLRSAQEMHVQDVQNITQSCQSLQNRLEEMKAILEEVRESMENNQQPEGACRPDQYKILDEPWRMTNNSLGYGDVNHCDRNLQHGWYRFQVNGMDTVIPTSCVETHRCQTHAPQWVDLQGRPLPEVNQEVEARACAHWSSDCCNWESPITVRNCGAYFVYNLQPRSTCYLAYCVEPR